MPENFNIKLYDLRKKSGAVLGGKNRIALCGCAPVARGNISVIKDANNKHYFNGLQSCGNVWLCPVCSVKIATKRQEEVQRIMYHFLGLPGVHIGFLTLTISHKITDKFKVCKKTVLQAWRDIQQSREYRDLCYKYRHLGDIRNAEIKVNKKNGWHPHLHMAVFAKCNPTKLMRFGNEIIKMWLQYHGKQAGRIGQSFSLIYNEKGISQYITKMNPLDAKWSAASELTMTHLKTSGKVQYETYSPFDLLSDLGDPWKKKKYCAYAYNIKGTRQLTFSKQVRRIHKLLNKDKTDEQIANEAKEGELIIKIERELWRDIVKNSLQAYVLNKLQKEHITALILYLCTFDIYTDFDEGSRILKKIAREQKFLFGEKDSQTPLEMVQDKDLYSARCFGIEVEPPKRDINGKIVEPGRKITKYRIKGDIDWQRAANKWLTS